MDSLWKGHWAWSGLCRLTQYISLTLQANVNPLAVIYYPQLLRYMIPRAWSLPFFFKASRYSKTCVVKVTGWDDPPPEDLHQKWEAWIADLEGLKSLKIPRCYFSKTFNSLSRVELDHFSDASTIRYGMCTYLRAQNEQGNFHCSLVAAKARVAPTKITTIPRLKLSAALLSAEVSGVIKEELDLVNQEFFWTDSHIVLCYLNNEARIFHIFVANRIQKIWHLTDPKQWHYMPTELNPVDCVSRRFSAQKIINTDWFEGPSFLWMKNLEISCPPTPGLQNGDPEVKTKTTLQTLVSNTVDWNDRLSHCATWNRPFGQWPG